MNESHHVPTTKSTLFMVSKNEWYTKEGTGKSMKNALYVQMYSGMAKRAEATSNRKKNQACSLNHCQVLGV